MHSADGPARQGATSDSLDSKAFQVFSAASVVLGFGSFASGHLTDFTGALYAGAGLAYLIAGWFTLEIVRARNFRVTDAADRWWPSHRDATASYVRGQMLDDLAEAAAVNRVLLKSKGEYIKYVLAAAAIEVLLVSAAATAGVA
jgi:hypothetical protein